MQNREIILKQLKEKSKLLFGPVFVEKALVETKTCLSFWKRMDFLLPGQYLDEEWKAIERIQERVTLLENKMLLQNKETNSNIAPIENCPASKEVLENIPELRIAILAMLTLSERMSFRLVCKKWKNNIDNMRSQNLLFFPKKSPEIIIDMDNLSLRDLIQKLSKFDYVEFSEQISEEHLMQQVATSWFSRIYNFCFYRHVEDAQNDAIQFFFGMGRVLEEKKKFKWN